MIKILDGHRTLIHLLIIYSDLTNGNYTEPTQVNWLDRSRHRDRGVKNNKGVDRSETSVTVRRMDSKATSMNFVFSRMSHYSCQYHVSILQQDNNTELTIGTLYRQSEGTLNWLVGASKLHKNGTPRCTVK